MRTPLPCLAGLLLITAAAHAQDSSSVTLPQGTRILTQLQQPFATRSAKPGDSVYLQTTFPVSSAAGVLIPAGTHVLATLDRVRTHTWSEHPSVELDLHLVSLVYANGYILTTSSPAHGVSSSDSRLQGDQSGMTGPGMLALAAPLAGVAIGSSAGGQHGAEVGSIAGIIVGGTVAIYALVHSRGALRLEAGLPIEVVIKGPLGVDQRRAAIPAPPRNVAQSWPAPLPRGQETTDHLCFDPGGPGTPDVVIPGTPETPPTIIPGTPATPGFWYLCR
jgi:hypothetical protein